MTDPTPFEQRVIDAARRGNQVQCDDMDVEDLANSDDPNRQIRAELIRKLLVGRCGDLDPRGIRISGARIAGRLDLDWIQAITGLSLVACALNEVTARYARMPYFDVSRSLLTFLHADNLRTDHDLILRAARVRASIQGGAVRILGAQVGGRVVFEDATIINTAGPAVEASRLHAEGALTVRRATVRGSGQDGAMRMNFAHIGGQVSFRNAELASDDGPALDADGFRTGSNLNLDGATVRGSGEAGALRMNGAQIGDYANLDDAKIVNETGPAIQGDALRVGDTLYLRGTTIRGSGQAGAIRMINAHIGSQLIARRMMVSNSSGPLIRLSEARVGSAVVLPRSVICTDPDGSDGSACSKERRLTMDRFTFTDLREVEWREWLHLIRHHTSTYAPFPYQQLAAIERAAGHDSNARYILIAQQDDLRRRTPEALGGRVARARHWAWGWLGRYGYRASRLLMALAMTLVLAGAVGWIAGQVETRPGHHAAERVLTGAPCSTVELIGLGVDRGLPLGVTGLRAKCDLDTGTRRGEAFTVVIWLIQAAVWALATLAVASYTGLIRKPT